MPGLGPRPACMDGPSLLAGRCAVKDRRDHSGVRKAKLFMMIVIMDRKNRLYVCPLALSGTVTSNL
jgi:hypothetical protein